MYPPQVHELIITRPCFEPPRNTVGLGMVHADTKGGDRGRGRARGSEWHPQGPVAYLVPCLCRMVKLMSPNVYAEFTFVMTDLGHQERHGVIGLIIEEENVVNWERRRG